MALSWEQEFAPFALVARVASSHHSSFEVAHRRITLSPLGRVLLVASWPSKPDIPPTELPAVATRNPGTHMATLNVRGATSGSVVHRAAAPVSLGGRANRPWWTAGITRSTITRSTCHSTAGPTEAPAPRAPLGAGVGSIGPKIKKERKKEREKRIKTKEKRGKKRIKNKRKEKERKKELWEGGRP